MGLRMAAPADADALLRVYAAYIDTNITFEYDLPTAVDFAARVADVLQTYPYLVWEEGGALLGYAYAHRYLARAAYQWDAELSVYLAPDARGRGLGTRLYGALLALLTAQGVRTAYALVTVPNPASEGLHAACGFSPVGVYRRTGYKNRAWHDVAILEKRLVPESAWDGPPAPLTPCCGLPAEQVSGILAAFS